MGDRGLTYDVGHVMASLAKAGAWAYAGWALWSKPGIALAATVITGAAGIHAVMTACQAVIETAGRNRKNE